MYSVWIGVVSDRLVYLYGRLRDAAFRINPEHPDLVDAAIKRLDGRSRRAASLRTSASISS